MFPSHVATTLFAGDRNSVLKAQRGTNQTQSGKQFPVVLNCAARFHNPPVEVIRRPGRLSTYIPIYLYTYLPIYLSTNLSIYVSIVLKLCDGVRSLSTGQ